MSYEAGNSSLPGSGQGVFHTTHWSVIERARGPLPEAAREALDHLCRTYWKPIYHHARRKGLGHEDANDAAQELFAKLIRNEFLTKLGRERGRFRAYLLVCLNHLLATQWTRQAARKRGAHAAHLDLSSAPPLLESGRSPDEEFDYNWMLALVSAVMERLKEEYEQQGKLKLFTALKGLMISEGGDDGKIVAEKLGMSHEAARAALTRMRKRYRELFRQEVTATLANPFDADDEIRHLVQMFR